MAFSQILGFIGTALVLVAYLPQVTHLIKERCSAGISPRAFAIWFVASLFFLVHALMIHDLVFTTLQVLNLALTATIYFYARRYRTGLCESHLATQRSNV